jgi:hypothetical protein
MQYRWFGWAVLTASLAVAPAGCSRSGEAQLIPREATARQALETALGAWKEGRAKPAGLSFGDTRIEVLDATWNAGQKLQSFEIVSDQSSSGPRWFTVKLSLPKGQQTVKYAVLGKDPIWIYAEADYKKLSGM